LKTTEVKTDVHI